MQSKDFGGVFCWCCVGRAGVEWSSLLERYLIVASSDYDLEITYGRWWRDCY